MGVGCCAIHGGFLLFILLISGGWNQRTQVAPSPETIKASCKAKVASFSKVATKTQGHSFTPGPSRLRSSTSFKASAGDLSEYDVLAVRFCYTWDSVQTSHCSGCNRHWKQAQLKRSKSRSASQGRKKHQETDRKITNSNKEVTEEDIFPKVPWVSTTPRSRLPAVEEDQRSHQMELRSGAAPKDADLPPSPTLPPPPSSSGQAEESESTIQIQPQLEALKKTVMGKKHVSQDLRNAIAVLEKEAGTTAPPLTHGQLNQMTKIQKQIRSLKGKIESMDGEWAKFSKAVQEKYQKHQNMYMQQRTELVVQVQEKQQGLLKLNAEIQSSSQHLDGEDALLQEIPEVDGLQAAFEEMYPEVEGPEEMDGVEIQEMEQGTHPVRKATVVAPFIRRSPNVTSPQKVHKNTLKSKDHLHPNPRGTRDKRTMSKSSWRRSWQTYTSSTRRATRRRLS